MIDKKVTKENLIHWLRNEAGSSNPDYFKANVTGGFKLQQIPEEYADLLFLLREHKPRTYLELGIGNGGSFALTCYWLAETLEKGIAVDNLAYGAQIGQNEQEVLDYIKEIGPFVKNGRLFFYKMTTDQFFSRLKFTDKFDVIFIDADHSYEAAKKDYENSLLHINSGGLIIFHDINSAACPGIVRLWKEVSEGQNKWEFIHSETCGIGVIKITEKQPK